MQYTSGAVLDGPREPGAAPRRGTSVGPGKPRKTKRRDPLWAKLLVIFGALLMLGSVGAIVVVKVGVAAATGNLNKQNLLGGEANSHRSITGPKNILLVGVDNRPGQNSTDPIRADSIIVLHVSASHDQAYLVSIPRDTYVQIPRFSKTRYAGSRDKINSAFAFGSQNGGGSAGGVELLAKTINSLYGITFDAAAIVDFTGFQQVVNVLGGVDMYVDQKTISVHIGFDKDGKYAPPYKISPDTGRIMYKVRGVTPVVYQVGYQHLKPWQALDYVRQRELLPNGDYDRERHQQQFIKAIFKGILSRNTLSDPGKLSKVLQVVGKSMVVDAGGIPIEDWAFAMRKLGSDDMLTLKSNNGTFHSETIDGKSVETLDANTIALLAAIRDDAVAGFVADHPDLVTQSNGH